MKLSIWTLYQWMVDLGMQPEARIVHGFPCLHGNRLQNESSDDTVRVDAANESGFLTQMVNGPDCVLFPHHTELEVLNASSQAYEFFGSWECKLMRCIVRQQPLQDLVAVAYQVFGRPILVQRPQSGWILASTRGYDNCEALFWQGFDKRRNDPSAALQEMQRKPEQNGQDLQPGVSGVVYSPVYQDDIMEVRLLQGAREILTVTLVRCNIPFRPGERYLLESFSQLLKEYITHTARSPFVGAENSATLIRILEENETDPAQIQQLYRSLHWSFEDCFQVYCCRPVEEESFSAILRDALENTFPDGYVFCYGGRVVALINLSRSGTVEICQGHLAALLPEGKFRWGCSLSFQGLERFPLFFRQADFALRNAWESGLTHASIETLTDQCLRQEFLHNPWAKSLINPDLIQLQNYDRTHGTRYVEALQVYLLHGCNCTDTARSLNIPRNTLLYRISRIRQLLTGDLDQLEYRKQLLISLLLL